MKLNLLFIVFFVDISFHGHIEIGTFGIFPRFQILEAVKWLVPIKEEQQIGKNQFS